MKTAPVLFVLALSAGLAAQTFASDPSELPQGGRSLISQDPVPKLQPGPQTITNATWRVENGTLKVDLLRAPTNYWDVQFSLRNTLPIRRGDVIFFTMSVRVPTVQSETGAGFVSTTLQRAAPPWDGASVAVEGEVSKNWVTLCGAIESPSDYGVDEVQFPINLGFREQSVEIRNLRILNYGPGFELRKLPSMRFTYPGRELDAPWRKAAAQRIERQRKGNLTIRVVDSKGRPISKASVRAEMTRHAFGFGTVVNTWHLRGRQREDTPGSKRYLDFVFDSGNFNQIVFEGEMKWVAGVVDQPEWYAQRTDDVIARALASGFKVRGHTLLWPGWTTGPWNIMPERLRPLVERGDRAAFAREITDHVDAMATRYRGRISDWDVLNEAVAHRVVENTLGIPFLAELFARGKRADPGAKMIINDFSMLSGGAIDQGRIDAYDRLIQDLLRSGAKIEGIGEQGHFGTTLVGPERLLKILDRFARFKLPMQITEFDVACAPDEQLQADFVRDFYTAVFSHPSITAITLWGFVEGGHWMPGAGLWREDYSPKPAGRIYRDLVRRQWWTDARLVTTAQGRASTRGFLGNYRITVRHGARSVTRIIELPREGASLTIRLD